MSTPEELGDWKVEKEIGRGGNGVVYACTGGGSRAAIKVLRRFENEAVDRFHAEVDIHTTLREEPGVLPLLDAHRSDNPSSKDPPWLVTAIAVPLHIHLDRERVTVAEAIQIVSEVAHTLSKLAQRDIHHRDLKPSNLFLLDGRVVIGDFGLADFPGKPSITAEGRLLGPQFFIAPEMLNSPDTALAGPADVFSLAKVLWVAVTNLRYPYPGELRLDIPMTRASDWVDDPLAFAVDGVIARATRTDPAGRVTMAELADDLNAITSASTQDAAQSTTGDSIRRALNQVELAAADASSRRDYLIDALNEFLLRWVPNAQSRMEAAAADFQPGDIPGFPLGEHRPPEWSVPSTGSNYLRRASRSVGVHQIVGVFDISCSVTLMLLETGVLEISGAHEVYFGRQFGSQGLQKTETLWRLDRSCDFPGADSEREVEYVISETLASLPQALDGLSERMRNDPQLGLP